jgi:hypothetical protein
MNKNPTPKEVFQSQKDNLAGHNRMMEGFAFEQGLTFAQLQYFRSIGNKVTDSASALAAGYKLQGAIEFIAELRLLAEPPTQGQAFKDVDNLTMPPTKVITPHKPATGPTVPFAKPT